MHYLNTRCESVLVHSCETVEATKMPFWILNLICRGSSDAASGYLYCSNLLFCFSYLNHCSIKSFPCFGRLTWPSLFPMALVAGNQLYWVRGRSHICNAKLYFWTTHPPYVTLYNISLTHPKCHITNWNETPWKKWLNQKLTRKSVAITVVV